MCLVDLDHNCLSHYEIPQRLETALVAVMKILEEKANFDPFAGRKLYSYLFDLGYTYIKVQMTAHHLIFGKLGDVDGYNWKRKVEIAAKNSGYHFMDYPDGFLGFQGEFECFFSDPRRFTYTPLIACCGRKPI
jgi:hypothetical protein